MPKLYLYLDPAAGSARHAACAQILSALQPQVQELDPVNPSFSTACQQYLEQGLTSLAPVAQLQGWDLMLLEPNAYTALQADIKNAMRYAHKYGLEAAQKSEFAAIFGDDILISFAQNGAGLSLVREGKLSPLRLDFEHTAYRQRLLRGGRQKEAVSRAVLQGIADGELIFDATAGLGRESMILAHAGGRVLAFERQVPVWIILYDALLRAQGSRFFPFTLPVLHALGTIKDYVIDAEHPRPEVIYYDPMFPEREGDAQVKKDMFVFQQVIGHDTDSTDFLQYALTLASKRVVVKRPSSAPALQTPDIKCAYSVDGGQCRFDCYQV